MVEHEFEGILGLSGDDACVSLTICSAQAARAAAESSSSLDTEEPLSSSSRLYLLGHCILPYPGDVRSKTSTLAN